MMDIVKKETSTPWQCIADMISDCVVDVGDVLECRNINANGEHEEFYVMVVDGATSYSVVVLHNGFVRDVKDLLWYGRHVKSAQLVIESE